jgi:hypothetical protein
MNVHASPHGSPASKECLGALEVRFRRWEGAKALESYTPGLLTEAANNNRDTLALGVPDTSGLRLQTFFSNM